MDRNQFIKQVRTDVNKIKVEYQYPQTGDAFVHWAVGQVLNNLSTEDVEAACAVAGKNDKGIDAFWCDDEEATINIFAGKYSEKGGLVVQREVVTSLAATLDWLRDPPADARREVKDAAIEYQRKLQEPYRYNVDLYLLVMGEASPAAKQEVDQFNRTRKGEPKAMELYDLDRLKELYVDRLSIVKPGSPDVDLQLEPSEYYDRAGRALVATVQARNIVQLKSQHQFAIFQRNVRHYLGKANPVNQEIAKTLDDEKQKQHFWEYNNGLSIICTNYDLDPNDHKVHIEGFQIVNGCQTVCVLYDNLDKLDQGVKLLVKVMKAPHTGKLADKITESTNWQTAIKGRDLLSNAPEQVRLQNQFKQLSPPIFLERKAGEWKSLAKPERKRYALIDNVTAAQASLSFAGKPAEAKSRKAKLFDPGQEGYYSEIFREKCPEDFLLPWLLWQKIEDERRSFRRQLKGAEARGFENLREEERNTLDDKRYLLHATTHLLAMMGYLLKRKYGQRSNAEILQTLRHSDRSGWKLTERPLNKLYGAVEFELRYLMKRKLRKEDAGAFSFNNYFKDGSSIKELQLTLDEAVEKDRLKEEDYLSFLP